MNIDLASDQNGANLKAAERRNYKRSGVRMAGTVVLSQKLGRGYCGGLASPAMDFR